MDPPVAPAARRSWWPRPYELAPEALLAIGLTFFLIDETDAATSAFASTKAVTLMGLGTVGWVIARVLAARVVRWPLARLAAFTVAAAGVLAIVVLPAYDHDTVVETFPVAAPSTGAEPDEPDEATDQRTRTGSFRGIDHRAAGTVNVYRQSEGAFVVGLEEFDIQPGPDYDLYLVPGHDRDDLDGGVRLDDLRGNRGTQFYDVPAGVDLDEGPWTVLVWCETFDVPIANATPA